MFDILLNDKSIFSNFWRFWRGLKSIVVNLFLSKRISSIVLILDRGSRLIEISWFFPNQSCFNFEFCRPSSESVESLLPSRNRCFNRTLLSGVKSNVSILLSDSSRLLSRLQSLRGSRLTCFNWLLSRFSKKSLLQFFKQSREISCIVLSLRINWDRLVQLSNELRFILFNFLLLEILTSCIFFDERGDRNKLIKPHLSILIDCKSTDDFKGVKSISSMPMLRSLKFTILDYLNEFKQEKL